MIYRFMRMVIFFDLPAVTKTDHREYTKFVKFIKSKGFCMFQESVYTKLCLNETVVKATMKDIKKNVPRSGYISILTLSENQFASIETIIGSIKSDVINSDSRIVNL